MGFVRAFAVLAVSVSLGSWFGLGRPDPRAPREQAQPTSISPPSSPTVDPPLPQAVDPSLVPSFGKWPKTNREASIAKAWVVAEGPAHRTSDARRLVTFTFDDGPTPEVTPEVLALLKKHRVRATFFVIGRYLEGETGRAKAVRRVLKKVASAGHIIGNHSYSHANLALLSPWEVTQEIDKSAEAIARVTGQKPILFRPPYGLLDDFGESAVRDRDLELLLWSVEAQDMKRGDPGAMFDEMVGQLDYKEGGIVLLHDVKRTTLPVLARLLAFLRDRPYDPSHPEKWGYEIVDLPTYLRAASAFPRASVTHGT